MMQACTFERDDGSQVWGAVFSSPAETKPLLLLARPGPQLELGDRHRRAPRRRVGLASWPKRKVSLGCNGCRTSTSYTGVIPKPERPQRQPLGLLLPEVPPRRYRPPASAGRSVPASKSTPIHLVVTDTERDIRWIFVQPPHQPGRTALPLLGRTHARCQFDQVYKRRRTPTKSARLSTLRSGSPIRENQKWIAQYLLPARVSAQLKASPTPCWNGTHEHYIPYGQAESLRTRRPRS